MPIYHSNVSVRIKQKFLSYMLKRHGMIMQPDSELTNREALVLDLCRRNDLPGMGINTKRWRLTLTGGKPKVHRDFVAERLGVSKTTVTRLFASLEKKGRLFYYRQFGEVSYIPSPDELEGVKTVKYYFN